MTGEGHIPLAATPDPSSAAPISGGVDECECEFKVDMKVTRIHERVKPSTEKTTDAEVARVNGPAQYVLELPAGAARRYRLKEGQALEFSAAIPDR